MRGFAAAAVAALMVTSQAGAAEVKDLADEGKALIQKFGGTLKGELQAAMKDGGPVAAIGVCNVRAPEIGAEVAGGSDGWEIGRSSHRLRNQDNAPDAYTAEAIADFLKRVEAGEAPADIVKAEIVEEDGKRVFRMVKAIPTDAVCLGCHGGDEVSPETGAALSALYPQDKARGFAEGDMRGVFWLRKPLE